MGTYKLNKIDLKHKCIDASSELESQLEQVELTAKLINDKVTTLQKLEDHFSSRLNIFRIQMNSVNNYLKLVIALIVITLILLILSSCEILKLKQKIDVLETQCTTHCISTQEVSE